MTARTLPSTMPSVASPAGCEGSPLPAGTLRLALATAFPSQYEGRQRRQSETQGFDAAVGAHGNGFDRTQVAPAGAAVISRIGIDDFAPKAALRYADQKIIARDRREIAHHQKRCAAFRLAQERDNAHFGVADIPPFETVRRKIHLVQRR